MKQALCVARHDVAETIKRECSWPDGDAFKVYNPEQPVTVLTPIPHPFLQMCKTSLLNREWCETNPTYLQLLPYIVLLSEDGIFMYRRGKGGKEDRLHDLYSIGVGGHIEEQSVQLEGIENSVYDEENDVVIDETTPVVIADTIRRELQEEVGIVMTDGEFRALLNHIDYLWWLYSDKDQVGSVHLGLTIGMIFDKERFGQSEKGVILEGRFVTVDDIKEGGYTLEQWSQLLVDRLDEERNDDDEICYEEQFTFLNFSPRYSSMDTVEDVNVSHLHESPVDSVSVEVGSDSDEV